jgi:phage/plasmid-associated DNA primase
VTLIDKIITEKEAIFARAIQWCKRLLDRWNFIIPEELIAELDSFIKDNDSVEQFLEDGEVVSVEESKIYNQRLYDLYKMYCFDTGLKPLSQRKFNVRLVQKWFEKFKDGWGRWFLWLSQKPSSL